MDIAKYVGLFLIKNEYCFLPGLGSLQIEKKPAVYDKETQKMSAPVYEVQHRRTGGSIDDSFANFIANNERISIVHASNYLRDFCARAKEDLKVGKEVIIPSIGKFVTNASGAIQFITDPQLHIEGKAIPFFKNSTAVEQKKEEALSNIIERTTIREPKADEAIEYKAPSVNWGKIILLIAIILVVAGSIGYILWYLNKSDDAVPATVETIDPSPAVGQNSVATDTSASEVNVPSPGISNTDGNAINYKVILHQYPTAERATARANRLISYGNSVEVFTKDSSVFYVVLGMSSAPADTSRIVDSLRRLFNPAGQVEIIR